MLLASPPPFFFSSMKKDYICGWGHLTLEAMPQENYTLQRFNWDKSLENLRKSSLIVGDLGDEEIGRTRGVACAHVKVKEEKVAFNLSQYGKLQISHPNAELLRRAKSQLNKLIACSRWIPTSTTLQVSGEIEYQSIMDLPEAKEANWNKIPKEMIIKLNQWFQASKDFNAPWFLDFARSFLASYAKNSENIKTKENKSLKEKIKEWFSSHTKLAI